MSTDSEITSFDQIENPKADINKNRVSKCAKKKSGLNQK